LLRRMELRQASSGQEVDGLGPGPPPGGRLLRGGRVAADPAPDPPRHAAQSVRSPRPAGAWPGRMNLDGPGLHSAHDASCTPKTRPFSIVGANLLDPDTVLRIMTTAGCPAQFL